jgi:hypothetical protein
LVAMKMNGPGMWLPHRGPAGWPPRFFHDPLAPGERSPLVLHLPSFGHFVAAARAARPVTFQIGCRSPRVHRGGSQMAWGAN